MRQLLKKYTTYTEKEQGWGRITETRESKLRWPSGGHKSKNSRGSPHSYRFSTRVAISRSKEYTMAVLVQPSTEYSAIVREAFAFCERMARAHYENFPVASRFLRADRRPFVWSVYAFARTADDFADEGDLSPAERLKKIDEWERKLDDCVAGRADDPVFIALAETIRRTEIPRKPLADLLNAFRMDVTTHRYQTFGDLLGYCECSANPIGRLVLWIFGNATERTLALSDNICTALQLTNFWQDISVDWRKNRIYIPLEDFPRFGYTESDLEQRVGDNRFSNLVRFQVERTRQLLDAGAPLVHEAIRPLRFELALTVNGGRAMLRKVEKASTSVLTVRPSLSLGDKVSILFSSMFRRSS
jgi:squalene synthase HpnC